MAAKVDRVFQVDLSRIGTKSPRAEYFAYVDHDLPFSSLVLLIFFFLLR